MDEEEIIDDENRVDEEEMAYQRQLWLVERDNRRFHNEFGDNDDDSRSKFVRLMGEY
jgi:hypothetical protein